MSKIINAAANENNEKLVEIKHMRTMQDADGNEVQVIDWTDRVLVDDAIKHAEENKANLEAKIVEVDAELVQLKEVRDAE